MRRGDPEACEAGRPHEQIERNPGKPGVRRLARLLDRHAPKKPKKELERNLLRLVRGSDLPEPEVNAYVLGKERDLVWREQRLVVESDSYSFHSDARTWARDIGKNNDLQLAAGWSCASPGST